MSSFQLSIARFNDLQPKFGKRSYLAVRYVFGEGFRKEESLVAIFRELHFRLKFSLDDAEKIMEDVAVACGYGMVIGDNRQSYIIQNHGKNFSLTQITEMQTRALFVKVLNSFFDSDKWLEFRQFALDYGVIEDQPMEDIFDVLRELDSRKKLGLGIFRDILRLMNEWKQLDVIDAYTKETGEPIPKGLAMHDYKLQVSEEKIRSVGEILRKKYVEWNDIPVNEWFWPPLVETRYITLAIVSNRAYSNEDYFTHRSLHKQPEDDIRFHKREESFEIIFPENEGDFFSTLLSGRPGIGKTVLLTKICKTWAKHSCFNNIAAFVHISLRDLFASLKSSKPTLHDMLGLLFADSKELKQFCRHIEAVSGKGVCFAFDGLDEYPLIGKANDIVTDIISKQKLFHASVIVTSRPTASHKIRGYMRKHAEIIGFLPKEVESYISEYYPSLNPNQPASPDAKNLLAYLEHHPNVKDMCYLPLHLAMIVHLNDMMLAGDAVYLKEDEKMRSLPETESDIYYRFVIHSIIRYILKEQKVEDPADVNIKTFEKMKRFLSESEYELFKSICLIAFHSKAQSRIIFNTEDIEEEFNCQLTNAQLNSLKKSAFGIISSYGSFTIHGRVRYYSFQHLTFQEFLAAYYISELPEEEQFYLLEKYGANPDMREVWRFFFGFMKNKPNVSALFLKIAECFSHVGVDTLFLCRCIFETQSGDSLISELLSEKLVLSRDKKLDISGVILSAPDCSAIGFVLCHTASILTNLLMNYCQVGEHEFGALTRQIENCEGFPKLKNFQIRSQLSPLKQEGADDLLIVLKKMPKLNELRLYGNQLESIKLSRLVPAMETMRHLQILVLTKNNLDHSCGETISMLLENFPNLIQFYASYNPLTTQGLQKILPGLLKCSKLQRLGLRGCNLDENAGKILSEILVNLKFLDQLELYWNCLGDKGIQDLSVSLQNAPRLQQVSFTKNEISDEGGCLLAQVVGESRSIHQIRLFYNNFSPITRTAFYNVVKQTKGTRKELRYAL